MSSTFMLVFLGGPWRLISGPQACKAGTLLRESTSPAPPGPLMAHGDQQIIYVVGAGNVLPPRLPMGKNLSESPSYLGPPRSRARQIRLWAGPRARG